MVQKQLQELGFSKYEIACYLALVANHPANGSQLSKLSGLARSRIYDVLRNLTRRGFVDEVGRGKYVPLPPEELIKRLRSSFEDNIKALKDEISHSTLRSDQDHIWSILGYGEAMNKARDMITNAGFEIYIRLFPEEGQVLEQAIRQAGERGVVVKYVAFGESSPISIHQVHHRDHERVSQAIGGRSIDLVIDRAEALSGIFRSDEIELSPINWSRNQTMITTCRDLIRHEFFSAYLYKTFDLGLPLSQEELETYEMIKNDY